MDSTGKSVVGAPHWSNRIRQQSGLAGADAANQNKRWAARKKSEIPGYIYSDKIQTAVRCIVRDVSSSGALVQLRKGPESLTVDDIPETFTLVLKHYREQTEVKCIVVRRFADGLGVRYAGQLTTYVKAPAKRR